MKGKGKFEIVESSLIETAKTPNCICYQIISKVDSKLVGVLNDFILLDIDLFRIWLSNAKLDINEEDYFVFKSKYFP
ncbi:hypothetical protein [Leptospira bouyouniensis]|uniref:hypothetical protein n=1 Tax=Leptospira bouyouniensis TaxID=2484911 RepID=UPI0014386791|nr:hypothetical protein [Leptospira bouyouniensis]